MTRKQGWDSFSFSELLAPPIGWKVDAAILTTYSADLVAIVHALLALSGFDFDQARRPSQLQLIKATDALLGRVRVLVQQSRIAVPKTPPEILRLMDRFIHEIPTDERKYSFHPKISLVRYCERGDSENIFWRLWLGSRNLTRSFNWEAGVVLEGRENSRGQKISSLPSLARELAQRARLSCLQEEKIEDELEILRWETPDGCEVSDIRLLGPGLSKGFPKMSSAAKRVMLVSPFLDQEFVQFIAGCGGEKTTRYILSTDTELQKIAQRDHKLLSRFAENVYFHKAPDLSLEVGTEVEFGEEASQAPEDEETEPGGLHAKLLLVEEGKKRRLWIGSANGTSRAWNGKNYEAVAELTVPGAMSDALLEFITLSPKFSPNERYQSDEDALDRLETIRNELNLNWRLKQVFSEQVHFVVADGAPPIPTELKLEVAFLGGSWNTWPHDAIRVDLTDSAESLRSEFLQFRISVPEQATLSWITMVDCDPPINEARDRKLIGRYLDPKIFLVWIRSLLTETTGDELGGDWDAPRNSASWKGAKEGPAPTGEKPTLEEILRSWARDPESFQNANKKFTQYFSELEKRTSTDGNEDDKKILAEFRGFWDQVAEGLQ